MPASDAAGAGGAILDLHRLVWILKSPGQPLGPSLSKGNGMCQGEETPEKPHVRMMLIGCPYDILLSGSNIDSEPRCPISRNELSVAFYMDVT